MRINIGCRLRYRTNSPTGFAFQIEAARADGQRVVSESLSIPAMAAGQTYRAYVDPVTATRKVMATLGPGQVEVSYQAEVDVDTAGDDPASVVEFDFQNLPPETLEYLAPSRYCPSDTFTDFAHANFSNIARGHQRVAAICDWVFNSIRYQPGATNSSTTAIEIFHGKAGVCRDFAHLAIALTRACGIPARYVSAYADNLAPQDFHAMFQAYLCGPSGGQWYAFDPTRMTSVEAVVRIAAGRDAADVAFAWPQGPAESDPPEVWADAPERDGAERTRLAVGA